MKVPVFIKITNSTFRWMNTWSEEKTSEYVWLANLKRKCLGDTSTMSSLIHNCSNIVVTQPLWFHSTWEQRSTQMTGMRKKIGRWQRRPSTCKSLIQEVIQKGTTCKFTSGRYKEIRNILLWEFHWVLFLPSSV